MLYLIRCCNERFLYRTVLVACLFSAYNCVEKVEDDNKKGDVLKKRNENDLDLKGDYNFNDESRYECIEDIEGYDPTEHLHDPYGTGIKVLPVREVVFPNFPVFAATSKVVQSEKCRIHSETFRRDLQKFKMWALMMYDASAKLTSGVLEGNGYQLGHFDECLRVNALFRDKKHERPDEVIRGKYCLASFDIYARVSKGAIPQAVYRAESFAPLRSTIHDAAHGYPRVSTLNWGVCVPASCSPKDIERALKYELAYFNETVGVEIDIALDEDSCVEKENMGPPMTFLGYFTAAFLIGAVSLALYATFIEAQCADVKNENDTSKSETTQTAHNNDGILSRIIQCFALQRTTKELLKPAESDGGFTCIHGIKAFFGLMLYAGHKCVIIGIPPYDNKTDVSKYTNSWYSALLRASVIYADSFLFLSGFLLATALSSEIIRKGRIDWVRRISIRYIRFTPPLLLLVMSYAYLSEHLGSGPLWRQIVGGNAKLCKDSGWMNVLHVQNFGEYDEMCAPQTHQLAIDTQLSIIAPFLIYLLHHYDMHGLAIVMTACILSCVLRFYTMYNNSLASLFFHNVSVEHIYKSFNLLYGQPLHRATPYVFGVIIGYYMKKHGASLRNNLNKTMVSAGSICAVGLLAVLFAITIQTTSPYYVYDRSFSAWYGALAPLGTAMIMAWLVCACYLGYAETINRFLSRKPLVVFSRITYSLYLIQFLVFYHSIGELRSPIHFTWSGVISGLDVIAVFIATALTLILDYPIKEVQAILSEKKKIT